MIGEIASEIRARAVFGQEKVSFITAELFRGSSVTVTFFEFQSGGATMDVINLRLSDDRGYSVSQDLMMDSPPLVAARLLGLDFESELADCLELLHKALTEMT